MSYMDTAGLIAASYARHQTTENGRQIDAVQAKLDEIFVTVGKLQHALEVLTTEIKALSQRKCSSHREIVYR